MKLKRYYYDGILSVNTQINLEGDEFRHLSSVMRTRVGENIELFCGDGYVYLARVDEITKRYATIFVINKTKSTAEPTITLDVFQALAKGEKLSLITQKITELGASSLYLFDSKFADVKANTHKAERLDAITISACKQCGRTIPLKINGVISIKQMADMVSGYDEFLVLYENATGLTLADKIVDMEKHGAKKVAVVIGAEGGFAEDEIKMLEKSGATIVSLGKRILRTETASIISSAVIMQMLEK